MADFLRLSTDRPVQVGMSAKPYIGPIPAASIARVAERYGDEAHAFEYCIRRMDNAYLDIVRETGGDRVLEGSGVGDVMRGLGKG